MHVVLERVAMESQVISPAGDLLSFDIETGGQSCGLQRVVGETLEPFTFWQMKKLPCYFQHVVDHGLFNCMVLDLKYFNFTMK